MAADSTRSNFQAALGGSLLAGTLLGLAGFAGNWFRLHLFLNIDLLLGSFFVMLALLRYGTGAGIVASVIASSCTLIIWKHPYAMVIFIAEATFVGWLNTRRNRSDLLLHDILFWIVCGAPLVWIFYYFRMGDSATATYLIMVKQALNGITNSLLASIFHLAVLSRKKETERPTLRQTVFITMVSLVLFTACLHIFRELRSMKGRDDARLAKQTEQATEMARSFVSRWLGEHHRVVISLAERIGDPAGKSPGEMQHLLETLKDTSSGFWRMGVFDRNATAVAYSPTRDELGKAIIGTSIADRPYIKLLKEQHKPYVSAVLKSRFGTDVPVVPLVAPILSGGQFAGFCTGVLKLDDLQKGLQVFTGGASTNIIVLDQSGQVVTSSGNEPAVMARYIPPKNGSLQKITQTVNHWIPAPAEGKNLNQRWAASFFRSEAEISSDSHWKVVVETSYRPVIGELQREAAASLTQLLLLSIFIIPISSFISFRLTHSLAALRQATISLPDNVQQNLVPEFPDSNIQDIHGLMTNFKSAVLALQSQHQTLIGLNRELADMSRERLRAEERYRTLVEMSPDAVIVQQNGCIVFTNRAALYLLGANEGEELYGSRMTDYLHAADREMFEEHLQRTAAGESSSLLQVRGQNLDGREIVMEYVGVPVTYNDRPAVQAILRDITERKHFEDLIRRGKEEWECTFDSVPDLIAIMDNQHRMIRVNRPMAQRLGRTPEECVGLTCYEVIHDTVCPPWLCPHAMTIEDGQTHEADTEVPIFGGDFLVTTSPLYDANGEIYASVHMARDISALKQARKVAEKSAAELESIFAAIQDAIVIYDTDRNVVKVNPRFVATYGFDPVGLNLTDVLKRTACRKLDGQTISLQEQPTSRALRGETVLNQQVLITRDDGSEIALEASSMPLRLDDNTISGAVTVWHDISDSLRDQQNLRDKESRYRNLVEHAPFAIFINRDNRIEYANPATLELFAAASPDDIIGRPPYDFFDPELHGMMRERINTLLAGGNVSLSEMKVAPLDGHPRYAEVVATTFSDRQGVAIQVMLHDITLRKQNEKEIQTILERLSLAQKSAGAGLWDWDIRKGTFSWSPELFALFGLNPGCDTAGIEAWQDAMHPEDLQLAEERVRSALEESGRLSSEFRIVLPSGEIRWISAIGDTIYDAAGMPLRMSGICLDITLRKQAEERLNLLANVAATLLTTDTPLSAINNLCVKALHVLDCQLFFNFIADRETGRLHLNACGGVTAEERQNLEWLDYGVAVCGCVARDGARIVAEHIPDSLDPRTDLVRSLGVTAYACHPLLIGEEVLGTLSFGSRSRSTFTNDDLSLMKAVTDLVSIAMERENSKLRLQKAHDALEIEVAERTKDLVRTIDSLQVEMAERLKAEEELRTRERLLIQQSRLAAMGEMISNIAHQWRQPLNTLGLIIQRLPHFHAAGLLNKEFLDNDTRDAMNLIRHMSDTIDDFRDFFRPDKERTVFNVKKAVDQAISLVEPGLHAHNIELETRIDGGQTINGYPSQFAQVILNILFNARDALLERGVSQGRIAIEGSHDDERLVLTIRDNAGGIPDDIIDKVFDPYFTTKGPDRGTGIGLFMAKSIIEKSMGGRITVRNHPEGAEFKIEV